MSPQRQNSIERLRQMYADLQAGGRTVRSRRLDDAHRKHGVPLWLPEFAKLRDGLRIHPEIRRGHTPHSPFAAGGVPMSDVAPGMVTSRSLLRRNGLDRAIKRTKPRGRPMRFGAEGTVATEDLRAGLGSRSPVGHRDLDDWGKWGPDASNGEIRRLLKYDSTSRGEIQSFLTHVRDGCAIEGLREPLRHDDPMKQVELESGRLVHLPDLRLAILQSLLAARLGPIIESKLPATTFAFRRGRSVRTALFAAWRLAAENGLTYACSADIRQCFPSVTIEHVEGALVGLCPEVHASLRRVVRYAIDVDILVPVLKGIGEPVGYKRRSSAGHLLQGAPVAPMLANLVLAHVTDLPFLKEGPDNTVVLRWADDLLILARDPESACDALEQVEEQLYWSDFELNEDKCTRDPVNLAETKLEWLGHKLSTSGVRLPLHRVECGLYRVLNAPTPAEARCALCSAVVEMTLEPVDMLEAFLFEVQEQRPNLWMESKGRVQELRRKRRHRRVRFYRSYQQVIRTIGTGELAGGGAVGEERSR